MEMENYTEMFFGSLKHKYIFYDVITLNETTLKKKNRTFNNVINYKSLIKHFLITRNVEWTKSIIPHW